MNALETIKHILQNHVESILFAIPSGIIGILILLITWAFARVGAYFTRKIIAHRISDTLFQNVIIRFVKSAIVLMGIYLIFELLNLTGAAFAIISGTGVIGIILGIAFRDITENFLSSILLSIHHPFQIGDFVVIGNYSGYVQGLTMRVTILKSSEGQQIQIPNSVVYKSHIRNFTINPNRREDFLIGIGFENRISHVQELILSVLRDHEHVLKSPEPSVLVESIENAIVRLRIYFWLNGKLYCFQKVKSSVIRVVKQTLQAEKIRVPLNSHEIVFSQRDSILSEAEEVNLS